jgi:hypothetical protein
MALPPSALGCTHIAADAWFTGEGTTRWENRESRVMVARGRGKNNGNCESEVLRKVVQRYFDVSKDGPQKARAECFTRMHGDGGYPTIWMSQKNVAATGSDNLKTDSSKSAHGFLAGEPRETSHTEICWMPTSSRDVAFWRSCSRHNSTTSCTRFIRVSRFLAWV